MRFSVFRLVFIDGADLVAEKKRNEKEKHPYPLGLECRTLLLLKNDLL